MEPSGLLAGRYEKIQTLGRGSFGLVQLARDIRSEGPDSLVAIKFLNRDANSKYMEPEILNHSSLSHPHIINFKEVFLLPKFVCLVMEYAPNGSLTNYIQRKGGRLEEEDARWFFQQLIIAMDYCHKKGVANRDIKLDNTLLMNTVPPLLKICDFGFSKGKNESNPKSMVGTPLFMAPEVFTAKKGNSYDGKAADVWSTGVILYVMLFGRFPFKPDSIPGKVPNFADESRSMVSKMLNSGYAFPPEIQVSGEAQDLLRRIFTPSPDQRIRVDQIMRHPWFAAGLPEGADCMNDCYLTAGFPPGRQLPEDTRRLLQEAWVGLDGAGGAAGGGWPGNSDAMNEDQFIDEAIEEDRHDHNSGALQTPQTYEAVMHAAEFR